MWLILLPAAAAQPQMFKWTDANGVVHYTQSPPPKGAYQAVQPAPPPPSATPARESAQEFLRNARASEAEADRKRAEAAARKAEAAQACSDARDRLAFLEERPPRRLATKNADGSLSRMTEQEWMQRKSEAQKRIEQSCSSSP